MDTALLVALDLGLFGAAVSLYVLALGLLGRTWDAKVPPDATPREVLAAAGAATPAVLARRHRAHAVLVAKVSAGIVVATAVVAVATGSFTF